MANDAEGYIAAVADACQAAGLHVLDYWTDDIEPRDGAVHLSVKAEAGNGEEDWELSRTLGWDEEKGWMWGEPKDHHGELHCLLWLGDGPLPEPAQVAAEAKRIMSGLSGGDLRALMHQPRYRSCYEDDPGFDAALAAYAAAPAAHECGVTAELGGTAYACREHDPDGRHVLASRWPACPAPWCRLEPGHRELHDIPAGTPEVKHAEVTRDAQA